MPLKIHLIIVSSIIMAVFIGWQVMRYQHLKEIQIQEGEKQRNTILVVRANWGLNCDLSPSSRDARNAPAGRFEFDNPSAAQLRENNVRDYISNACGMKTKCSMVNSPDEFGFDPAPRCYDKELLIEYRCFSFDRLWQLNVPPRESGIIDCSNVTAPK